MAKLDASKSGTFKIGGEIKINRLGFGAMRVTGKGIWGPPEDRPEALRTLKRVPELGINFIDTADSYGPDVSEELIHETLFPYKGMLIATKAGFQRRGPSAWQMDGRPDARAARGSVSSASISGNCTASIRKYRARHNLLRSSH
jgi:pyridoxine 4-dehydrogenase